MLSRDSHGSKPDTKHRLYPETADIIIIIIIIVITIKKCRQCKAGKERLTPYQSEDTNPTILTNRMKEEREITVGYQRERAAMIIQRH